MCFLIWLFSSSTPLPIWRCTRLNNDQFVNVKRLLGQWNTSLFYTCALLSLFRRLHNATLIFASIFPLSSFPVKCAHFFPSPPHTKVFTCFVRDCLCYCATAMGLWGHRALPWKRSSGVSNTADGLFWHVKVLQMDESWLDSPFMLCCFLFLLKTYWKICPKSCVRIRWVVAFILVIFPPFFSFFEKVSRTDVWRSIWF